MHHVVLPPAILLRSAFELCVSRAQAIFVAAITFALLGSICGSYIDARIAEREDVLAEKLGVEWADLRVRVQDDLRALSLLDSEELLRVVDATPYTADIREVEHIAVVYAAHAGPMIALLLVCMGVVLFLAKSYFFLLFTAERTGYAAATHLPFAVFGMAMTSVWVMIRSLFWLPFVGLFVGAYTIPRLSLASVYYAHGGGVLRSATQSWRRTSGLWVPMTLRLLLLGMVCVLLWWIMLMFVAGLALFWMKGASLLGLFGLFILMAYFIAGLTVLAR